MSNPAHKAGGTVRRIRRRVARWAAPELDRELHATKRRLRAARAELRDARARIDALTPPLPPEVEATIARVGEEHLTYLEPVALRELAAAVRDVEDAGLPGMLVEAGTALGGSAIVMAAAKGPARPLAVYDVFGMIPAPGEGDGADVHARYAAIAGGRAEGLGGDTYYGYRDDLLGEVTASFARLGVPADEHAVTLVPGLFEDTIAIEEPVALAHLDGDWYASTMTCLNRIAPQLVPGGRIVLDDYRSWSGCRRAVDEFFAGRDGFALEHRSRLHVVRTPA
jgi:asparagine synthase (glutamine-hydrolysing)